MRYFLVSLVIAGVLLISTPCFADSGVGVSITLTTIVVDGGSGGGSSGYNGGWMGGSGEVVPYGPPDWTKVFPQMTIQQSTTKPQPQYTAPTEQTSVYVPLPISTTPSNYIPPVFAPVAPQNNNEQHDMMVVVLIILGAIFLGLVVCLFIPSQI